MSAQTLDAFLQSSSDRPHTQPGMFELERDRLLQVHLKGHRVWMKMGAMVAYRGQISFEREGLLEQGLGQFLKKFATGEGAALSKASGTGDLYLADSGKKITLLQLNGQAICVNGNDILCLEDGLKHEVKMMRKVAALASGGLFNVMVSGQGVVAITTHYEPLTLRVTPDRPVFTDPNATVAWSANLSPAFKTDIQFKTFLGRGSGESVQMQFQGDGFVVVQPYEEVYHASVQG
ncbi:MAG: AIM24 family protein [Planctomycetaceae bacterium]|nr:AIM24 family protein [Phycisphaerales bacterium]MCE2653904.1 AIM24 family protein [Planctomycetaceae bacterium]